ncbi:hypothetical protein GRFL_0379 [Christiangramia flava JLT2011]|uniref:Uncharacterized protein n=1 Tax=Christiangramia flava JLT2011 TaxID=1229726 RepID=A0A1L7I1P9_9FLAO|nr:hypothetical protein GRFL_0379 [Christiangramia flava JLT2011]
MTSGKFYDLNHKKELEANFIQRNVKKRVYIFDGSRNYLFTFTVIR